jgi:hypothetical protein
MGEGYRWAGDALTDISKTARLAAAGPGSR